MSHFRSITQAVLLAGGKGTRLSAVLAADIPKPMAPIRGRPLLERLILLLASESISDVVLLVHYRADVVRERFGDGSGFGLRIRYVEETEPQGTGGALRAALPVLHPDFLVLYGDTLVDLDFSRFISHHVRADADLTLFVHPNDHPQDSDLIETSESGRVTAVLPYPHPPNREPHNLVNAAFYAMKRDLLESPGLPPRGFDIAKQGIPVWIAEDRRVFAYRGDGYIKDMGTPERLVRVEGDLLSGMVARKSGRSPRPAVFIDRDGTLNVPKGHLARWEDFELLPGAAAGIRRLNQMGVLAIVVTNQPVVARGDASFSDLDRIHRRMENLLAAEGAYVDATFVCPHHPDKGFAGERAELKIDCGCRKPATGLIDQARQMFSIDVDASWLVGDTIRDLECARRAGIRSILVQTGSAGNDGAFSAEPQAVAGNLGEAIDIALSALPTEFHPA